MNNFKKFNQFLNEGKVLSPANVKKYQWDKTSVNYLKNWSYKIKDLLIKFSNFEYFGTEPSIILDIRDPRMFIGRSVSTYLTLQIEDKYFRVRISQGPVSKFDETGIKDGYLYFDLSLQDLNNILKSTTDNLTTFIDIIEFLVRSSENEIYDTVKSYITLEKIYVIKAGEISPASGKTDHHWSIYNNSPTGVLLYDDHRGLLYSSSGRGIKIGDSYTVYDDQKRSLIFKMFTVNEIIPCNYDSFVAFSKRKGAKVPVGSFQKQPGRFSFELYSIK